MGPFLGFGGTVGESVGVTIMMGLFFSSVVVAAMLAVLKISDLASGD
jgi:hypothetical protein